MTGTPSTTRPREHWSGRAGFILATIGSAVGIGSIWKFPYEVGANGGLAFVVFYLLGLVLIVVPLLLAEFAIGRRGGGDAATSIGAVAAAHGAGQGWAIAGLLGILTSFLILSFYSVIGGWTIAYAVDTVLHGLPGPVAGDVQARFDAFLGSPARLAGWHGLFMALTAFVVAGGVAGGIEIAVKLLMPALVTLMVGLAAWSIVEGDLQATLRFMFRLDPAYLNAAVALDALGLGFFSIGVGLGLMITYAAYSRPDIRLAEVAAVSVVADCAISFLAGFAVFPIVFAHGLDPAVGAGLVFVTLPLAFASMPFGTVAAVAFFLLMFVAALASAISMLEASVALLLRHLRLSRAAASVTVASLCFLAGLGTVLSFNAWSGWHPLAEVEGFRDATLFDLLDYLTSNIMLPAGGLAIALFVGWAVPVRQLVGELELPPIAARLLCVILRFVVPAGIAAVAVAPVLA
jgi:neurotransmitter:Na+ symporter, NSS family